MLVEIFVSGFFAEICTVARENAKIFFHYAFRTLLFAHVAYFFLKIIVHPCVSGKIIEIIGEKDARQHFL